MEKQRENFGSKFGVIAAAAGSAVGLGNIYRFPCEAGENGGGAFLIVYLLIIVFLGIPLMLSEFIIGRRSHRNTVGAFKTLAPKTVWPIVGFVGVISSFLILAFYSTIAGWTLECIYKSLINFYHGKSISEIEQGMTTFNNSFRPFIWQTLFIILTAFIVLRGIEKGIEKYAKVLMPMLFVILIILCVKSLTLPNATEGLKFFFKPDFSKITPEVCISALGQAFFSLSVGMGVQITYGSYINKKDNLLTSSTSVVMTDTLVAILAGITIFPAAFAMGISPKAGAGLAFNTLPLIFNQMAGGYIFCLIFFILLAIAALTSTISLLEASVAYFVEEHAIKRKKATIWCAIGALIVGLFATLSLKDNSNLVIGNMSFFNILDNLTANILMPVGGLLITIFIGWRLKKTAFIDELTNQGTTKIALKNIIFFITKYIAPLAIVTIIVGRLVFNIK